MSLGRLQIIGLVTLFAGLSDGIAQTAAAPVDEQSLLREGARLLAAHHDEAALRLFEQAHAQSHSAQSLAQIGIAEGALGRWLMADEHLRAALAQDDAWIKRHAAALDQARAAIGEHIGELELEASVPGTAVRIDDRDYGRLPLAEPLRLVAGSATLTASAPGYQTLTRPIRIVARTKNREVLALVKIPLAVPAPLPIAKAPAASPGIVLAPPRLVPVPARSQPRRVVIGGILTGLGGAVAATGAALLGVGATDGSDASFPTVGPRSGMQALGGWAAADNRPTARLRRGREVSTIAMCCTTSRRAPTTASSSVPAIPPRRSGVGPGTTVPGPGCSP